MKRIYLILIFTLNFAALWGQCPSGSLNITSQAQIDNFAINYPNCTQIAGGVTIDEHWSTPIYNLNGLSQVTSIGGDIRIYGNHLLENLTGLDNLTIVGGLDIYENDALVDLTGLENISIVEGSVNIGWYYYGSENRSLESIAALQNVDTITGSLVLRGNPELRSPIGLENLKYVGSDLIIHGNHNLESLAGLESLGTIMGNLEIGYGDEFLTAPFELGNRALKSLEGLENLNTIEGSLIIANQDSLTTLSELENVSFAGVDHLEIFNNSNLSVCNLTGICDYFANGGSSEIYNNAPNCNSMSEMLLICTDPVFCSNEGVIFTQQQQIDSFAISYPDCQFIMGDVVIQGDSPTSITNLNGLSQITYIGGTLTIQDNAALTNLSGLELLVSTIGGLDINNNDGLENLYALANLTDVQGELSIRNNAILTGLSGIHNITGPAIEHLTITNNPMLSSCSIKSTCDFLYNGPYVGGSDVGGAFGGATIYGNVSGNYIIGPRCGSRHEVALACPQYLPIELTHFQAQIQNKTALLTWQTATETHNEGFEVQRSKDGTTWEKIGWQDGQGDSQTPYDYTYTDENPLSGTSYYRLKQIDFDGAFSHSDVVKVEYESNGISIYPNPKHHTHSQPQW